MCHLGRTCFETLFACPLPNIFGAPNATPQEYAEVVAGRKRHVLLDVRAEVQFSVCALENAVNVPLARLEVGGVNGWALSLAARAFASRVRSRTKSIPWFGFVKGAHALCHREGYPGATCTLTGA